MYKTFGAKTIILLLAFMQLIFGILPTNVVFADEESYERFYCEEDGEFILVTEELLDVNITPIGDFGNNGIDDIYYEDKNGNKLAPETDGSGRVKLKAGETYFYKNQAYIYFQDTGKTSKTLTLKNVKDVPNLVEKLNKGESFYLAEDGRVLSDYEDEASFIEKVLTRFILIIGTGFYVLFTYVIGEKFSIESVIFNQFSKTNLSFFANNDSIVGANTFIMESGIREVLNEFFSFFSGIAIVVYLIILVYMGIKILLGSTAEKGSKYKELILYWLEGVLILFLFPYIMKYSIHVNNAFVAFLYENKDQFVTVAGKEPIEMPVAENQDGNLKDLPTLIKDKLEDLQKPDDFMGVMFKQGYQNGWLVQAICWFVMFLQMIGFLVVYFKRVLITMFLIAIFPLVMISYAVDKIGDTKSQAFDNWLKEFLLNVFLQSFHAITYVLVMSIIALLMDDPSENWLLMLIALTFVSKGDNILRDIFTLKGTADTVKGIGAAVKQTFAISQITKGVKDVKSMITNPNGLGARTFRQVGNIHQKAWDKADNRTRSTAIDIELRNLQQADTNELSGRPLPQGVTREEIKNDAQNAVDILLGRKSGGASPDEIRNAADKLVGYMNQKGNADVQDVLNEIDANLSPKEKEILNALLKQNVYVNALMVGGREVNVKQNVDIILSLLQRDANGNFTPESLAILNKIAESEADLKVMKLFGGNVKFNKKNVIEVEERARQKRGNQSRVSNHPYFAKRDRENNKKKYKGREAARENKEKDKDAKTQLEAIMKGQGSTLTTYSAKNTRAAKKANRTVYRTKKPGQERASGNQGKNNNTNSRQNTRGRTKDSRIKTSEYLKKNYSKFKDLKRSKKPWQNVDSVTGSAGLETAKYGAKAKFKRVDKNQNVVVQTSKAETITPVERVIRHARARKLPDSNGNNNGTTTNYGSKVPGKVKLKLKADTNIITTHEQKQQHKEAMEFFNEQRSSDSKKGRQFNAASGAFAIKRNRENQRREKQAEKNSTINMPGGNQMETRSSGGGTMQNAGAEIANRQGSAENLQEILNSNREKQLRAPRYTKEELESGKDLFNYFAYGKVKKYDAKTYKSMVDHAVFDPLIGYSRDENGNPIYDLSNAEESKFDKQTKKDFEKLGSALAVLTETDRGKYTARQLLDNIQYLQSIAKKYENSTGEEKAVLDNMINFLDCDPEDYESYIRVRILNDPDSVGNDRKIIEECKDYVKNTEMPSSVKNKVGYNLDDLEEGVNPKYVHSRNTNNEGIVSDSYKSRVQEEYDLKLKRQQLEQEKAKLDRENKEKYSAWEFTKEGAKLAGTATLAVGDAFVNIGAASVGFMAAGMTTDGKTDTAMQAASGFFTGFTSSNQLYGNTKEFVSPATDKVKDVAGATVKKIEQKFKKEETQTQQERLRDYNARVNELRDKTQIDDSSLFGNRK